jgi:hypothetical protein
MQSLAVKLSRMRVISRALAWLRWLGARAAQSYYPLVASQVHGAGASRQTALHTGMGWHRAARIPEYGIDPIGNKGLHEDLRPRYRGGVLPRLGL